MSPQANIASARGGNNGRVEEPLMEQVLMCRLDDSLDSLLMTISVGRSTCIAHVVKRVEVRVAFLFKFVPRNLLYD